MKDPDLVAQEVQNMACNPIVTISASKRLRNPDSSLAREYPPGSECIECYEVS